MIRYNWKVQLIEHVQENIKKEPIDCTSPSLSRERLIDIATNQGDEGRRLRLRGSFDHSNEVRIGPRAAPAGLISATSQGE